jgi:hypothetical protein
MSPNGSQNSRPGSVPDVLQQTMSTVDKIPPTEDIELAKLRDGYPALAAWMACDIDDETLVFRRFSNLAARNILHLQAQLIALEQEILDADAVARGSKEGMVASMRWETLMRRSKETNQLEFKRVQDMERLKALLKDYCNLPLPIMVNRSDHHRRGSAAAIAHCWTAKTKRADSRRFKGLRPGLILTKQ